MNRQEVVRFLVFRTLGNFFILLTVFGFAATFGPSAYFEAIYRISSIRGVQYEVADTSSDASFGDILARKRSEYHSVNDSSQGLMDAVLSGKKDQVLAPKDTRFSLVIPKIGASEKVFENVDPANDKEYTDVLKGGIAHAKGSAFPGYGGNTYIFAHSANSFWDTGRNNAVFYLLKELELGDEVVIFFLGKRFNYEVTAKKIVEAEEVKYLTSDTGEGEILTLQTCWPPGTTWKRLLVFAKPVTQ